MEQASESDLQPELQIVYVLENDAMPGLIKIGRTNRPIEARVRELSSGCSVPMPFRCVYAARVADASLVETHVHAAFAPHRIAENKEFFRLPAECAVAAIEMVAIENVTPAEDEPGDIETFEPEAGTYVRMRRPVAFSKQAAKADLVAYIRINGHVPSQDFLRARWGSGAKSTISDWLAEWERDGLISRSRIGKCNLIEAG